LYAIDANGPTKVLFKLFSIKPPWWTQLGLRVGGAILIYWHMSGMDQIYVISRSIKWYAIWYVNSLKNC